MAFGRRGDLQTTAHGQSPAGKEHEKTSISFRVPWSKRARRASVAMAGLTVEAVAFGRRSDLQTMAHRKHESPLKRGAAE